MRESLSPRCEMAHWDYGRPPSALDLARDGPALRAGRLAAHALVRLYLRLFHGLRPPDRRRLGALRGHLIVANHSSHLDALVLSCAFPLGRANGLRCLCASDYFFCHPLKRLLARLLGNVIPMDRRRFDARAVAACRAEMRRGANVILFPEGTRSVNGRLGPFKAGVGLLALEFGLPVLPAFIHGAHECCRKGRWFPRPGKIRVSFGQPVRYAAMPRDKTNWVRVARDLERRVARLSDPNSGETHDHELAADPVAQDAGTHGRAA
jgi:1-acyl-sn-glycerol-3-phosphate acyltransferase